MRRATVVRGSAARITSPMTAIPLAPALRQRAALPGVIPPSATTGPAAAAMISVRPSKPQRRSVAGFAFGQKDRAYGHVIGARAQQRSGLGA